MLLGQLQAPHEVAHLPTWWRATSVKGRLLKRVCTVLDAIGRTQKGSLAGVPLLPRPRVMENMRYEELWVAGRSGTHGGRPRGRTGLLGTQSKIVLHFVSIEMP